MSTGANTNSNETARPEKLTIRASYWSERSGVSGLIVELCDSYCAIQAS